MSKNHIIPGLQSDEISDDENFPVGKNRFGPGFLRWLKKILIIFNLLVVALLTVIFILFAVHFIAQPKTKAANYIEFAEPTDSIGSPRYIPKGFAKPFPSKQD